MSLINRLRTDQVNARKARDTVSVNLLTSLVSEAAAVGKNNGNRESTDAEVIRKIKQFVGNTNETIKLVQANIPDGPNKGIAGGVHLARIGVLRQELALLEAYLPKQLGDDELTDAIVAIRATLPEGANPIGGVMKALKEKYDGLYDPAAASAILKKLTVGA